MAAYELKLFLSPFRGLRSAELRGEALQCALNALCAINVLHLRTSPGVWPELYSSGVRYQAEPLGREDWTDIPETLARKEGDCEDLACWRAAELQARGIQAVPFWSKKTIGNVTLFHIRVRWPNGRIEDPSRILGMNDAEVATTLGGLR